MAFTQVGAVFVGILLVSGLQVFGGTEEENGLNSHQLQRLNLSAIQEVTQNCSAYCKDQVQYNSICLDGCKEWEQGLREGCGIVCNGREGNFREFHACQVGCSKVVEDYYFYITGALGVPDSPTLVSSSLKDTSLALVWDGSLDELPHLVFTVQKKTFQRNQPWETLPVEPLNATTLTVTGLRPYTEYQFRVGWIIAQDFPPLYSLESIPIVTLANGLPNPPEITSIQPISNTSVSITWLPPSQPNGPLIAYILKLQNLPDGHLIIKEIPIVTNQNQRGYTFSGLLPHTNYSLAISSLNRQGEGDSTHFTFFTPQSPTSNDISKNAEPKLLIQGIREIYLQAMDLRLEPEVSVYVSNRNVTGMSAHFRKNLVFIATADGEVIRTRLGTVNETKVILTKDKLDIQVSFLSVDWLHDKLYLVGKKKRSNTWSIRKADLNGGRLQTVLPNIGSKPVDFMADPYTGYLYWVAPQPLGTAGRDGLYKMDLIENEHFPTPVIPVLEETGLGPFTIDFTNYRILIVHKAKNTVLSVTLDGEQTNIRDNTHNPNFEDVVSIGNYGGVFYWTTGQSVVVEEYNEAQKSFYHNSYEVAKSHQPSNRLLIFHPSLQPIPSPMAPPQSLHGVFSQRKARIIWRPPPQIAGLGDGSWGSCGWSYEVRLSNNVSYSGINETQFLIENLEPSTEYSIQVLAYSTSGQSPLTPLFRGHTLRESSSNVSFLWASESGLYGTDALGDSVQPLFFPSSKDAISSLAASSSAIFFSLANGSVFQYQIANRRLSRLDGISFAHSLAFDSTAQKIYWSNPKKQAILRASVPEAQEDQVIPEYLPLVTTALEITLDSGRALLIWTTGHSIEIARLNGRNQQNLVSVGLFSGVRILSVSIDSEEERIFWLTRSSTGSALFQMNYNRGNTRETPKEIARFEETSFTGPIRFYSDRLLVLQSGSQAMIQELNGEDSLIPVDSISNITHVLIVDEKRAFGGPKLNVTPSAVLPWSISLAGKWDFFTISWQAVSEPGGGAVFYDISINDFNLEPTSQSFIRIDNRKNDSTSFPHFDAYTEIEISITAATFWTSSKATVVKRRTPSGKPSEPLNPRIFLERIYYPYFRPSTPAATAELIGGELRWDTPEEPNGVILGYLVHCWKDGLKTSDCFLQVDLRKSSAEIKNLTKDTSYQFAIQGYTDAGVGRMSRKIQVETNKGNPLAKLLLTKGDKVEILDIDKNGIQALASPYSPHTIAYLALEETLFWFDEGQYLMRSRLNGTNKTRIHTLKESVASNLVVNWISRKLFWISESSGGKEKFSVEMLDLGGEQRVETLVNSSTPIRAIAVNPFTSSLLWTTSRRNGIVTLYSSVDDGGSEDLFLSRNQRCNCSRVQSVGDAIAFDGSGLDGGPSRGILFTDHGTIWLSDEEGCNCFPVVNFTAGADTDGIATPFRLASDKRHIYWISSRGHNSDALYAGQKGGGGITQLTNGNGPLVREIGVIGPTVQPFPDRNCLIPVKLEVEEAVLLNHSAHSLTLRLPRPETFNCSLDKLSTPTPSYSVYYGTVDEKGITACTKTSADHCLLITNGSSVLQIKGLHPYTSYTLFLSVTSYYAQQEGLPPIFSSPVVFTTAPGAPMPPKLLSLRPLTPTSVQVRWAQPEKLNGGKVWYAVEWEAVGSKARPNHIWAVTDAAANQNNTEFRLNITTLLPGSHYAVWVVAYSEIGDEFSKSEIKEIWTFGNPNNISLILATPHRISISWTPPNTSQILKHQFVYRLGWSSEWNSTSLTKTVGGHPYNVTVEGLKPKQMYGFRVKTWYAGDPAEPFYWPLQSQMEFETLADKPGPPGLPIARGIGKSIYEVSWAKSEENGAVVDFYSLECRFKSIPFNDTEPIKKAHEIERRKRDTVEVAQKFVSEPPPNRKKDFDWVVVYNGTENRWEVVGLDSRSRYEFRVRSKNVYGWSEYSRESTIVSLDDLLVLASEPQNIGTVFAIIALGILILAAFALLFIYVYRRKQKEKPALQGSPTSSDRRELELATLRELPGGVHQNNILYAADLLIDFDTTGLNLQKVKRNQITLLVLLGSGAFGDVYEGYARTLHQRHLISGPLGSRVAIKVLRKGATTEEKLQFVEEARLMGQFHHPHILELLGICIDADPCLILELMSGGDLLSHLRSSRSGRLPPTQNPQSTFSFGDLLEIALHVARGCAYLEEKHFVHRDLAARNCLVRITVRGDMSLERVVKIGDFGLARDVYRNDYYRKEGGGLLPVRWMPPESLIDGVFTTQSDVWSFGVLLWEILTLGHQPYPARSNVEVLNYVRTGGRLQEPPNSPPSMTWLMFCCWEYEPQNRPTFKDCLQHLERIAEAHARDVQCLPTNQIPQYHDASQAPEDLDAPELEGTEEEESPVFSQSPHPQHYQEGSAFEFYETRPQVPFPKYLELLGSDSENVSTNSTSSHFPQGYEVNDGYEIPVPRKPPRNVLRLSISTEAEAEIGLPSPPPYANTRRPYQFFHSQQPYSRTLLASTTSEEEYLEMNSTNQNQSTKYAQVQAQSPSPQEYMGFGYPGDTEGIHWTRPRLTATNGA